MEATIVSKPKQPKIPADAETIRKEVRVSVEEIENGYLICKSYEIQYQTEERGTDWVHYTKKYYSQTNPFDTKNKALSEIFK